MENVKEYKKYFSKMGFRYACGWIINQVAQLLVLGIAFWLKPEWKGNMNMLVLLSAGAMYLIGLPILIAWVSRLPGRAPQKHKMKAGQFILACIICFGIMYASNFIGSILVAIIGVLKGGAVDNVVFDLTANTNIWLIFAYTVLLAPVFEEFIFRKLLVDRTLKYGQGTAIVMSGVMFGLFHGNLSQCIYATTLGMFLAFLYIKTGELKITIGIHMLVNFMGGFISTLVMEGIDFNSLLEIMERPEEEQGMLMFRYIMENLVGWTVYMLYGCAILGLLIAGIVLLIVFRKRFVIEPGEIVLPKGQRFQVMFVNAGMILYCLLFACVIIAQLFGYGI